MLALTVFHPVVVFDEDSEDIFDLKDLPQPGAGQIDTWFFVIIIISMN